MHAAVERRVRSGVQAGESVECQGKVPGKTRGVLFEAQDQKTWVPGANGAGET